MPSKTVFLLVDEILASRIVIISRQQASSEKLEGILRQEGFDLVSVVPNVSGAMVFLKPLLDEDSFSAELIILDGGESLRDSLDEIWMAKETFEMLEIPLIITGDYGYSDDIVDLIESGCIDYIPKPLNPINLVARLKMLLNLRLANRKLKRHQIELQAMTSELEKKNRKLNSILEDIRFDLQLAGELQRSFLPSLKVQSETAEFAFFYKPCETIGGDLINVVPVSSRYFVVYLLDVSGHGVSAALSAFAIHRNLSSEWNKSLIKKPNGKVRSPKDVLGILNHDFLIQNELFKYFTITYGIYDSKLRLLRFCRAGQTPLLIIRNDGTSEFLTEGSPPVGVSKKTKFSEHKLQLFPGDRIYLYSDGFTEAKKAGNSFFGEDRLMKGLRRYPEKNLQSQVDRFTRRFFSWLGDEKPKDDIALLGILIK